LCFLACSTPKTKATANIVNLKSGEAIGTVTFVDTKRGVLFRAELKTKENATLGIHIHEYGDCRGSGGKSAGGHWNPTEENHGNWGSGKFHSGDLGNIKTDKNGKGTLEILDEFGRWSFNKEKRTSVLNKAIIVHAGMDDKRTQPSGAAGKRIGCGIIKTTE
jgi:Cu-Zn family superoxide dismutase